MIDHHIDKKLTCEAVIPPLSACRMESLEMTPTAILGNLRKQLHYLK